jgi:hypothetical protein
MHIQSNQLFDGWKIRVLTIRVSEVKLRSEAASARR